MRIRNPSYYQVRIQKSPSHEEIPPYRQSVVLVAGLALAALLLCGEEEPVLLVVCVGGPGEGVQPPRHGGGRVRLRLAGCTARRGRFRFLPILVELLPDLCTNSIIAAIHIKGVPNVEVY
jgi:hypothetical protein